MLFVHRESWKHEHDAERAAASVTGKTTCKQGGLQSGCRPVKAAGRVAASQQSRNLIMFLLFGLMFRFDVTENKTDCTAVPLYYI